MHTRAELEEAIAEARAWPQDGGPVVIHVETDPLVHAPDSDSWWDVPVSEVSTLESTKQAYAAYEEYKAGQRIYWPRPSPREAAEDCRRGGLTGHTRRTRRTSCSTTPGWLLHASAER